MTDYSKTTDFTGKNSLPDSDPDKVISGVDFDLEFNAVAAASASKADTTYVDAADALKLDKTGGIVSGDLGVTGDIDADGNVVADGYILGNASLVSQSNYPVVTAKHATVLSGDLDNAGGRFQVNTQDNATAGSSGFLGNDQKHWTFKNFKSVPEWRWNDGSDVINARLLGGNLSLPLSTPTSDDHAMTRGAADARYAGIAYVDAADALKLDKTGGTISGTLGVTGDTTVSNIEATGVITADLGLVGAPSIDFGSTTGFYTPANQTVGVTNAGALTATFNNDGTISTYPSGSPEEVAIKSYVDARTPIARMKLAISAANQITILSDVGVTSVLRLLDDSGTDYYYQVTLDTALVGDDWTYAADAVRSDVAITSVFYPNLSISGTRGASGQFEFKIYNSATGTLYKDQNMTVDVTIWSIP